MRTLGLLTALLVLALPGRAEPLKGATQQVADTLAQMALSAEDQAPVMDGQDQLKVKERDMAMSFDGDERLTREASARRKPVCSCRHGPCKSFEKQKGVCDQGSELYRLCCFWV